MRCSVTGNPVGTDTWEINYECQCVDCQKWLSGLKAAGKWPPVSAVWIVDGMPSMIPPATDYSGPLSPQLRSLDETLSAFDVVNGAIEALALATVPRQPTDAMLKAGAELVAEAHRDGDSVSPYELWRQMIAAYEKS